jgi:ferric-dicitrate binding protein FerR (iron transport regulator)
MEMSNTEYWDLLAKYLQGEASEQEKALLFAWMEAHPDNKALFDNLKKVWHAVDKPADAYTPDVEKGWHQFQTIAGISRENTAKEETQNATQPPQGRTIRLQPWVYISRIAAVLVLAVGILYFVKLSSPAEEAAPVTVATQNGKQELYLPDSSRVVLNKNSSITYSSRFNEQDREVKLSGEAFFDVRKSAGKTFTVYSGNTQTQVLGTSFTVSNYEGKTEVQVVSGKVAFSIRNNPESTRVLLTPGLQAVETGNGQISQSQIRDANFLAWKDNKLTFNNTSMKEVVATLEQYFGIPINITDTRLLECRFTGSYQDPTLQEIIDVLVVSVDLTYTQKNGQYTFLGPGCK